MIIKIHRKVWAVSKASNSTQTLKVEILNLFVKESLEFTIWLSEMIQILVQMSNGFILGFETAMNLLNPSELI